jgi:hypothetical protein
LIGQFKKNLLFILHDCIAIYEIGVTSLLYIIFAIALQSNKLEFSCLFCMIALQSIKLELPPFLFCAIGLQSIKLELTPFYLFFCDIKLELPPFYIFVTIALPSLKVTSLFILRDCIAIY